MTVAIVMPKWGMGLEEGTIVRWLKNVGETVVTGEPIVEIETAKATQAVDAPASGTLLKILLAEGQTAAVNTEIGVIEVDGRREAGSPCS